MKKTVAVALCAALAACSAEKSDRLIELDPNLPVAETVNGTPVPQALIDAFVRVKAPKADMSNPDQRAEILRVLSDYVLLAEQARHDRMQADPAFAAEVEVARLSALANGAILRLQQQTPITDDTLRAEYDGQVARAGKFEYDFSSLLFANAEDARKAAVDAQSGKPFAQVYDEWKGKVTQAKIMTKTNAAQMPAELAKAVAALKPGETLATPVQTEFGWHLVNLTTVNPYTPPPFEQVKESLREPVGRQVARQRLEKMREQAKIEYPASVAPPSKPATNSAPAAVATPGKA